MKTVAPGSSAGHGLRTRRVRYSCAISLDGYIAGPGGEFDWIVIDPDIDFREMIGVFDTLLAGRRSFEVAAGGDQPLMGLPTYVFSRTLRQSDYRNVTIVGEDWKAVVQSLREGPGKDIWLFGGGTLFRSLVEAGLVDTRGGRGDPDDTGRRHSAGRRTWCAYPAHVDGATNLRQDRHRKPGVRGEPLRTGSIQRTGTVRRGCAPCYW